MRTRPARKSHGVGMPAKAAVPEELQHLEFLNTHLGTLPAIIGEADLVTLNAALRFFFYGLSEARRLCEEKRDFSRTGTQLALAACWQFVVLFEEAKGQSLHLPILRLQDALKTLEYGLVQPILKKRKGPGRPPSSYAHMTLKGQAAATVKHLTNSGLGRTEAFKRVAQDLSKIGMKAERGSGHITANTVRNWCTDVAKDVGRKGTAATTYDGDFTAERQRQFSSQDAMQRHALAKLSKLALDLFPELKRKAS